MVPAPSVIASRYRVLHQLGRGGMGVVYLVEHLHTGDRLALKVLLAHAGASPEVVERFKREARTPARIRSEHVVRVTDADVAPELGGAPFLVMECLEGNDLEKCIEKRGAFPAAEVVWILGQVALALDKAHAMGIVHRDLKPENIFLHQRESGGPIVKILDFGISKMTGEGPGGIAQAGLTRSGVAMGTPLYMAPEQARGMASRIGPATDMWALGLIAFRLLTGRIYWTAQTMAELMVDLLSSPMPPPSLGGGLPQAFDAWFLRSCDRDPARRWTSIGEQVGALADVLGLPRPESARRDERGSTPAGGGMPVDSHAAQLRDSASRAAAAAAANLVHSSSPITNTQGEPVVARGSRPWWLIAAAAVGLLVAGSLLVRSALAPATVPGAQTASAASEASGLVPPAPTEVPPVAPAESATAPPQTPPAVTAAVTASAAVPAVSPAPDASSSARASMPVAGKRPPSSVAPTAPVSPSPPAPKKSAAPFNPSAP